MNGQLLSVNRALATEMDIGGRPVLTGIRKRPVDGPVAVRPLGLEGDEQADLSVHGGLSKAVYAYPSEHYPFWQTVRAQAKVSGWGEPLAPGGGVVAASSLLDTGFGFGYFQVQHVGATAWYLMAALSANPFQKNGLSLS